jgi:hypothetical protein
MTATNVSISSKPTVTAKKLGFVGPFIFLKPIVHANPFPRWNNARQTDALGSIKQMNIKHYATRMKQSFIHCPLSEPLSDVCVPYT